jgi:hypothetical protein
MGLDVQDILDETGIPVELSEAENAWIDNDLLARLVKKIWSETNNETFGLDPNPLRIGTWALACERWPASLCWGQIPSVTCIGRVSGFSPFWRPLLPG